MHRHMSQELCSVATNDADLFQRAFCSTPFVWTTPEFQPLESGVFFIQKSAVFLRRFCLARKMKQGSTIQLSVVLFLSADNRCANGCTAADKQQGNPQSKVSCVAGLRRFGIVFQLRRHGVGFFDFLCTVLVAEILATAFAVPVLDIALGGLGRRFCREVL